MTKFLEWPDEQIDVLVGGTPCQSFSVAGLRRGLADPRGNLALVYLGILDKYRPSWCVWENVPGVLSSNGGRDFGAFLGALGQLGYSFAYRMLDAQHFGVPQRRRRVFVVGHLGDWRRAAEVLFEREGVRGDLSKIDSTSTTTVEKFGKPIKTTGYQGDVCVTENDIHPCLSASGGNNGGGTGAIMLTSRGIRRATPIECERLQGFPDNWTKVTATTKDGPRYKAIGNSMAVPVMRWIGEGIASVLSLSP